MERQQHSHNFHLFRWNKLVGAPSGDSIVRVAIGGLEGHELVAALLDSNELLLRLVSDGVLLAKHVRLSVNPSFSAVRGLAFDRSAQWLMLICDDLTVGLLPVFVLLRGATTAAQSAHHRQQQQFLLQQQLQRQQETGGADKLLQRLGLKKTPSQQANLSKLPFSDLQDLTVITPRVAGRTGATGCIWWRKNRWNAVRKKNVCITSYNSALSSAVVLLDLDVPGEEVSVKLRQGVTIRALSLSEQASGDAFLFVSTVAHGEWRMPLTLLLSPQQMQQMQQQQQQQQQQQLQSDEIGERISICDPGVDLSAFALVSLMSRFPAASRLSPQVLQRAHQPGSLPTKVISVYSGSTDKLLVLDDALGKFALYAYQVPPCSFELVTDRIIFCVQNSTVSIVSCLFAGTSAQPHFSLRYSRDSLLQTISTPSENTILGLFPSFLSAAGWNGSESGLEGCIVFTRDGVYELVANMDPREMFLDMVAKGLESKEAEPLGKACGLDVLGLYEAAAEKAYNEGNYGRALELFFLAEIDTAHLVQRYLAIGRLDVVMAHVASALRAGASLDRQRRAHLATLLSLCRLHLAVSSSSSSDEKDFLDWSSSDTDYDAEIVMSAALSVRAVSLALHVAHERDCVEKCVEAILASPALLPLTRSELMLIQKNGAMELRLLESVLEPQVHLSIAALSQRMVVPVIRATLPQMSVRELQFAEALLASAAKSSLETEHAEVYMSVVLALVKKLGAESAVDAGEGAKMLLEARKMHQASALDRKGLQQQQQQQQQIALRANDSFEGGEFASEQRVSSIASGWNHSACVLDGSLYSWGKCDHGALGVGQSFTVEDMRASKSYAAPQLVLFGSSVQIHSVACGGEHTLALDVDGSVWAFGLNDHGQLGTGDRLSCESPRPLSLTFRIKSVACGHSHSGLLDAKGRVWASGLDDDGQVSGTTVGRDVLSPLELSATLVATKKPMMAGVACGFAHTAVWSVDGEVFTVGNNVYGQLGRADGPSTRVTETVGTKRIHFASCGSFHTLAVTDLGSVYEWGGKGKQKPRLVEGLVGRRILEVCGGHSFDSICRTAQGEVWRWRQDQEVEAVKVEGCRAIAAGEDFFVVACTGGSVWSWGSGSYGQLGLGEVGVATAVPRRLAFPVAKPANPVLTSAAVEQDHLAPQHQTQPVLYVRKLYDLLLQLPANRLSNTLVELSSCDGRVASAVHLRQNRCLAAFLHAASAREGEAGLLTAMEDWVVQSKPTFDPLYQDCRRFLSAPFSMAARSSMMWAALWQWRRRGFNSQVLADWLQGKLVQSPDLAHIVQQLLLSPFSPPPPPECPLVVDVPIPVLLSIATSPSIHHVHEEDTARLWESVRSNLSKALDQDFIALNKVPASDSVVFSCGHTVSQESFRTQLASLRRALEDAPAWKGAAASIIDKEYALPGAIHMSCPRCVQSTM